LDRVAFDHGPGVFDQVGDLGCGECAALVGSRSRSKRLVSLVIPGIGSAIMSMTAMRVLGDTHHFAYDGCWITDLVQSEAADDEIELCIDPRQIGGVSLEKREVLQWLASASRLACCSISGTRWQIESR
jgi:hypothetical protein